MKLSHLSISVVLVALLAAAVGCQFFGSGDSESLGQLSLKLDLSGARNTPYTPTGCTLTLSKTGETTITESLTIDQENNQATYTNNKLKVGVWIIAISVSDADGEIANGTSTVNILGGRTAVAHVALQYLYGAIQVVVDMNPTTPSPHAGDIGYVFINESEWAQALNSSIEAEAAARSFGLYLYDGKNKQVTQISALRSIIALQADAIFIRPIVDTGWDAVLGEAKVAKIPVILLDRGVNSDPSLYATRLGHDFTAEGQTAADWLIAKMGGNQANIIELEGTTGSDPAIQRKSGFDNRISGHANMTILHSQTANFMDSEGRSVMASLLPQYPSCNVVYAHNDQMALGAIQAIKDADKVPGTDIILVSIDGVRGGMQAVLDGDLGCTVECNPMMGTLAFDTLQNIKEGQTVNKVINMPQAWYDKSKLHDAAVAAGVTDQEFVDQRPY